MTTSLQPLLATTSGPVTATATAPLGRAVIGGLLASTLTTLLVLPAVFAVVQRRTTVNAASLDPDDPNSGNVYRELRFPDDVYEHIQEYYEEKAEAA